MNKRQKKKRAKLHIEMFDIFGFYVNSSWGNYRIVRIAKKVHREIERLSKKYPEKSEEEIWNMI